MRKELKAAIKVREKWIEQALGHPLNPRSSKQMQALFYGDFKQRPIMKRRAEGPSTPSLDDEALVTLGKREPALLPLIRQIQDMRSMGVFLNTFVRAPLDWDERMRCSYNICGTLTYRLSSSSNAFGSGTNLQNLPKGDEGAGLPNIRKLFVPDPGYTMFDMDLDRADLQVVVWESNDQELKAMLREGIDIHAENARLLGISRQLAKTWVHGTNYGASARTASAHCGISVKQADLMRTRWFAAHPGIADWQKRVEARLGAERIVENRFGYRWRVFGRTDGLLPEALAWIPQSTVALVINKAWLRIHREAPEIQILLQVHDSLVGQFPDDKTQAVLEKLPALAAISIPYDDPLIIPTGIKTSRVSWGDVS